MHLSAKCIIHQEKCNDASIVRVSGFPRERSEVEIGADFLLAPRPWEFQDEYTGGERQLTVWFTRCQTAPWLEKDVAFLIQY